MSDAENKTENDVDNQAKETNTAPYMKKEKEPQPSKSNFVIPLILLVVSAIVIIATFYEKEYSDLIAKVDIQENETSATDSALQEQTTTAIEEVVALSNDESASSVITAATTEPASMDETAANSSLSSVETVQEAKVNPVSAKIEQTTPSDQRASDNTLKRAPVTNSYAQYQASRNAYQQNRNIQARKHDEMMQQRRQEYEAEMQARRQQYEAMMRAREEKRAQIYEAQKAIFQQTQNRRVDTFQKIQELHKQIEQLHNELHQLIQASRIGHIQPVASQPPITTPAEQI